MHQSTDILPFRSIWDAWNRLDAILFTRFNGEKRMEDRPAEICLLGNKYWFDSNGPAQPTPNRLDANVGKCKARHVVCPICYLHVTGHCFNLRLDADYRRHYFRTWRSRLSLVYYWAKNRLVPYERKSRVNKFQINEKQVPLLNFFAGPVFIKITFFKKISSF